MSLRNDIAPDTLPISLETEGIEVSYSDGRSTFYHGVPTKTDGAVTCAPGKEVHILVTDPTNSEGVLVYVNDRKTHDEILEDSGVGRVIIDRGERESLFPGVEAENHGYRIEVEADPEVARGRVFVFVEDDWGEQSYEIVREGAVPEGQDESGDEHGDDPVPEDDPDPEDE